MKYRVEVSHKLSGTIHGWGSLLDPGEVWDGNWTSWYSYGFDYQLFSDALNKLKECEDDYDDRSQFRITECPEPTWTVVLPSNYEVVI